MIRPFTRRSFLSLIAAAPIAALAPLPKLLADQRDTFAIHRIRRAPLATDLCRHCGVSLRDGTHGVMTTVGDIGVNFTCTIPATAQSPYWIRHHEIERPEYWYNSGA